MTDGSISEFLWFVPDSSVMLPINCDRVLYSTTGSLMQKAQIGHKDTNIFITIEFVIWKMELRNNNRSSIPWWEIINHCSVWGCHCCCSGVLVKEQIDVVTKLQFYRVSSAMQPVKCVQYKNFLASLCSFSHLAGHATPICSLQAVAQHWSIYRMVFWISFMSNFIWFLRSTMH